jgi:hypothetical protein
MAVHCLPYLIESEGWVLNRYAYLGMCTLLLPGCLDNPGISTSHRKQYKLLSDISRYSHNGSTLLAICNLGGRVSPKPGTHIRACARPCDPAAWMIREFLPVKGSNTNYYQASQDIVIMAVHCLPYLIESEGWVPNWVRISVHVHASATRLLGRSGDFYKSQEAIQTRIRHFDI